MITDFDRVVDGQPLKIATFDIETLGLKAPWAYVVCASVKQVNKNDYRGTTKTFRIDNYPYKQEQDKGLLRDLIGYLNKFDLILTWYGSQFDFPFITTRALRFGLQPPVKNFRRDLCLCARGFSTLNNNRLASWERWLYGKTLKTALTFEGMLGVIRGEKAAIDNYVDHCERDGLSTERCYKKFAFGGLLGKLRRG